jgi:nucleoside-diphosphate-sugar epimerase
MRVLLTGATGFIGSYLLERLLAQGDVVRVLVRPESLSKSETAQRLFVDDGVKIIVGTLTDAKVLAEASSEVDIVYHLAWQSNGGNRATPS